MLTLVNSWSTLVKNGQSWSKAVASCMLHVQGYPKIQTCNCHGLGNLYMHPNPNIKLCFIICSLMWIHTDVNGWIMCVFAPSVSHLLWSFIFMLPCFFVHLLLLICILHRWLLWSCWRVLHERIVPPWERKQDTLWYHCNRPSIVCKAVDLATQATIA